jgi:ribosome-binding protein aMBF1 (putative translation factor)
MVLQARAPKRSREQLARIQEAQVFALVLGTVVERLRRQRAMTQAVLALKVGASQAVISRIESGKMQPDALMYGKLAAAFGMTVQGFDQQVKEAVDATKRAATAVSARGTSADEMLGAVGALALGGLIAFAVAALLDGAVKLPNPKA